MAAINPLNIALSGLKAAQAQIGVTSQNVSNVSTDGYTRKLLRQYTTVLGEDGSGVSTGNIERKVNEILLKDYRTQISLTAGMEVRSAYMNKIQEFHGPPDAQQSISAEIAKLKDAFSQLTNQPENAFLISSVYNKAQQLVEKMGDFSAEIIEMRNNAQTEMKQSINSINSFTAQIATLNAAIKVASSQNRSTAELEDQRDLAIRELAKEIDLSYYKDENNVVVVMTRNGQLLADTEAIQVHFTAVALGAQSYYPVSANAVRLGSPTTGVDLTQEETLGGRLGELINLRDDDLPVYMAQVDELAHKMAMRFDSQGLRLFTLPDGTIPANIPTSYVGFAADMVVNPAVVADQTLIRKGTATGSTVQDGSNEVLRKIVEFAFGPTEYQQAVGTADISNVVPTLFATLGITGEARIIGTKNIQPLNPLEESPYINPGTEDTFTIAVGAGLPQNIVITGGMAPSGLVAAINAVFPGMAQLGTGGQLVLSADDNITIGAGTLGALGLDELGLSAGLTAAEPPYFEIAGGTNDLTTIQILPTDTTTQLLAKLNAISGLDASLTVDGYLQIVPEEGGDITMIDRLGSPLAALGMTISNVAHTAFNVTGLGPGGNLNGRVQNGTTLHDYATQAISLQSQDAQNNELNYATEDNYRAVLERQFLDTTGVNLDEEMSILITIQTAYNASARTIRVAEEMMDELMATFT